MKEIKYRVWDEKSQKMHYPDQYKSIEFVSSKSCNIKLPSGETITNVTPMLCTLFSDKNNTDIYEEDFVQEQDKYGEKTIAIVTYVKGAFCFGSEGGFPVGIKHKAVAVIGNKYENPDLLKVSE